LDIWYIWVSAITKKKSPAFWAREKLFLATPISERGNFNCKNEKSHTYATMANGGSIPMFFEMANRLQSLVLPQNHHLTHFDHTLLWASHNFDQKIWKSYTYATMENEGSIPMYFEATNRLQPLALPQNHHLTHFDHTLLWASHNFDQKIWKFYTYATMENEGSIPMYFEATNRLQPLVLSQNHHLTNFDHSLLWASHNFDKKLKVLLYT
jgi:hypothetical protein